MHWILIDALYGLTIPEQLWNLWIKVFCNNYNLGHWQSGYISLQHRALLFQFKVPWIEQCHTLRPLLVLTYPVPDPNTNPFITFSCKSYPNTNPHKNPQYNPDSNTNSQINFPCNPNPDTMLCQSLLLTLTATLNLTLSHTITLHITLTLPSL